MIGMIETRIERNRMRIMTVEQAKELLKDLQEQVRVLADRQVSTAHSLDRVVKYIAELKEKYEIA